MQHDAAKGARQDSKLAAPSFSQGLPLIATAELDRPKGTARPNNEVGEHLDVKVYGARSVVKIAPRRDVLRHNDSLYSHG